MPPITEVAEPGDWDLAGLARAGDEDAYATLIERHQGALHAFIYRAISDSESARDLTQEVFVRAWFALGRTKPRAQFTTWLFQIAVNLCRDHARSKSTKQSRVTDSLVQTSLRDSPFEKDLVDTGAQPDQQVQSAEAMAILGKEIAQLPVELREAFLLGAVDGHPHKEIAVMLGLSVKAIETRIYRARSILARRLSSLGLIAGDS